MMAARVAIPKITMTAIAHDGKPELALPLDEPPPGAVDLDDDCAAVADEDDMDALGYLVDVDVKRYPQEPRAFTLEFVRFVQLSKNTAR